MNAEPSPARRGILFILAAPSGSGKDSLIARLDPAQFGLDRVVSYTTRARREDERDGVDYHFVDRATMETLRDSHELLECTEYLPGRWYGMPRRAVDEALAAGRDVLIKPEVQGAAKIKAQYPDAVMIFLAPPSIDEAIRRLEQRGTESAADTAARIARMREELAVAKDYDYVVVNETGKLAEAVERVREIIARERARR